METKLLFMARVARRRIEVTERTYVDGGSSGWPTRTERAYSVRGNKVRDGSFYTADWTAEQAIARALDCARRHNPKAVIRVSWCSPCNRSGETWDVHEGRPSWHQQRAGGIGAAVTSGFVTEDAARAYADDYRQRHPGEPAIVLRHGGVCTHTAAL